ncbi:uncharacterized protein LY89DRAFT_9775 [Mollisia scopiformis]|uniref:2EXR domain-containing protein n=1 Tax=Mollisia scopiformis TaxID=149040 RepID=A0A194XWD3_MOLSC|nr:uncharacterized protein LY89DRAFT_9775 [Mollisia scopiformis]KUJ24037.1 hypothetical protein LY89DRAFT_9775 [Mollisia scopiformis]
MPPRRRPNPPTPPDPATPFPFTKLPIELRLYIWNLSILQFVHSSMINTIVPLTWDPRRRAFHTDRKPPPLLHTCQESRTEALKTYQLRFASSPELARVYFSYEHDILMLVWSSLGSARGSLERKMAVEECGNVRTMMISESCLLDHADDQMREFSRFTGLQSLCVLCDPENVECGDEYGAEEMAFISVETDIWERGEEGTEEWPELVCLRADLEDAPACSRHWWFDGWNQRAAIKQGRSGLS